MIVGLAEMLPSGFCLDARNPEMNSFDLMFPARTPVGWMTIIGTKNTIVALRAYNFKRLGSIRMSVKEIVTKLMNTPGPGHGLFLQLYKRDRTPISSMTFTAKSWAYRDDVGQDDRLRYEEIRFSDITVVEKTP